MTGIDTRLTGPAPAAGDHPTANGQPLETNDRPPATGQPAAANGQADSATGGTAARAYAAAELAAGRKPTGGELTRFNISERTGRRILAELTAGDHPPANGQPDAANGQADTGHRSPANRRQPERPGGQTRPPTRRGAGTATPARRSTQRPAEAAIPTSLVTLTKCAVAVVAGVTMLHSSIHIHDLAIRAGWGQLLAKTLPAAVDGLVIAGSTSLLVDHHRGRRGSPLAWAAVVIGLLSSMAANVVAVDPTIIDIRHARWVMAGYAPVAAAISGHLLLRMSAEQRHTSPQSSTRERR